MRSRKDPEDETPEKSIVYTQDRSLDTSITASVTSASDINPESASEKSRSFASDSAAKNPIVYPIGLVQSEQNEPEYSTRNPLRLLLRKDEPVKDYMDLSYFLETKPDTYTKNQLLYLLQVTFRKMVNTYVNTLIMPLREKLQAMSILNIFSSRTGAQNPITNKRDEAFLMELFLFLKDHLPQGTKKKDIMVRPLSGIPENQAGCRAEEKLFATLQNEFLPFHHHGLFSTFTLNTSSDSGDHKRQTELDTQLFLTDAVFESEKNIKKIANNIAGANILMHNFDGILHDEFTINTDLDRSAFPEAFAPLSAMEKSVLIFGDDVQKFSLRTSDYESKRTLWNHCYSFRESYLEKQFPKNRFDIRQFMNKFNRLPALYFALFENRFIDKPDALALMGKEFTPETWQLFTPAIEGSGKENTSPFLPQKDFYRKVFDFSECLLTKLRYVS